MFFLYSNFPAISSIPFVRLQRYCIYYHHIQREGTHHWKTTKRYIVIDESVVDMLLKTSKFYYAAGVNKIKRQAKHYKDQSKTKDC